jgi:hypothetical protein
MSSFSPGRVILGSGAPGSTAVGELQTATGADGTNSAGPFVNASMLYDSPDTGLSVRARTPTRFLSTSFNAGALGNAWTPQAGKKFRLMGYVLTVEGNASAAGAARANLDLQDGGVSINQNHSLWIPAAAGPTGPPLYLVVVAYPGNGYLSTAANNSLGVLLPFALVTGFVKITTWGTEE